MKLIDNELLATQVKYPNISGLQAVDNGVMTIYSSIAQHQVIQASVGEIRWITFKVAISTFINIELQSLN